MPRSVHYINIRLALKAELYTHLKVAAKTNELLKLILWSHDDGGWDDGLSVSVTSFPLYLLLSYVCPSTLGSFPLLPSLPFPHLYFVALPIILRHCRSRLQRNLPRRICLVWSSALKL